MGVRVEPLEDHVLIRPARPDEKSKGGIILPGVAQEKRSEGIVLETGPGKIAPLTGNLIEPRVVKGDHVVYSKYAGTQIKVDGEECLVIKENDILVRLVEE